jgi:hypothetical protein
MKRRFPPALRRREVGYSLAGLAFVAVATVLYILARGGEPAQPSTLDHAVAKLVAAGSARLHTEAWMRYDSMEAERDGVGDALQLALRDGGRTEVLFQGDGAMDFGRREGSMLIKVGPAYTSSPERTPLHETVFWNEKLFERETTKYGDWEPWEERAGGLLLVLFGELSGSMVQSASGELEKGLIQIIGDLSQYHPKGRSKVDKSPTWLYASEPRPASDEERVVAIDVDGAGRLRRVQFESDTANMGMLAVSIVEFSDFGLAVSIDAPDNAGWFPSLAPFQVMASLADPRVLNAEHRSVNLEWSANKPAEYVVRQGGNCAGGKLIASGSYNPGSSANPLIVQVMIETGLVSEGGSEVTVCVTNRDGQLSDTVFIRKRSVRPETAILQGPAENEITGPKVRFLLVAQNPTTGTRDQLSGVECSLDGSEFSPCPVNGVYEGLPSGRHIFAARAIDSVGNVDLTPAERFWIVE